MATSFAVSVAIAFIDAMIECRMAGLPVCLLTATGERAGLQPFVYGG